MAERARLNRISHDTSPAIVRTVARIEVYSAVVQDAGLDAARDFYIDNRTLIVPKNVNTWAERTGAPPEQIIKDEAITLFEKDKRIAERYDEGVTIKDQTYYLGDLIAEERGRLYQLRRRS